MDSSSDIAILGGSFDPVHNGHLAIAQLALEYFNLSKIFFIPAGTPPHKLDSVNLTADQRLEMLKSAIVGNDNFSIWEGEIYRKGPSYTLLTINEFRNKYPDCRILFIIGSDNIKEILTWHKYEELIKLVTFAVTERPGYEMNIPEELKEAQFITFPSPQWGVSSSVLRDYIKNGNSCRYLVPEKVAEVIKRNGYYK